ncbi:hypothetical protein PVAP13_9KG340732 [Panicum virgatum]|uniref:Uncharacterized protein n=1 Tax=Panicum virgatum TaxID=38727 RepID=A0A8T0NR23_PANVG|nr:hypothetical protein PVAP13_9KG340732 [Panicum virgatum]
MWTATSDPTWPLAAVCASPATQEPATIAMALHGSGRRRYGHRTQQLAAMTLRTAARRRRSARRHGRARGRGKRGRKLPPDEDSAPPEPIVAATTWGPCGAARALGDARVRADDAGGAGPQRTQRREQGMAAWPRGTCGRSGARRRREEDGGRRSSPSPPRSLRGAEPRRARPGPLLLRYVAVGEGEGVGREGPALSGVGPCSSRRPPPRRARIRPASRARGVANGHVGSDVAVHVGSQHWSEAFWTSSDTLE